MALISSEKSIIREKKMPSFHGLDFIRMFYKKSHDLNSELMSTRYIGFNIVKARKVALLVSVDKYTTTPIEITLIKGGMSSKQMEIRT